MEIIPSINVRTFTEARELLRRSIEFLPAYGWVHVDVADGTFTPNVTWGSPEELKSLHHLKLNTEIHLMIEQYEPSLISWFEAGAKRIVVQLECLHDIEYLKELGEKYNIDIMLSIGPQTAVEELVSFFNKIRFFQFLAVTPGFSKQDFQESVLEKIRFVRERVPDAILEVDGGITVDVARRVREVGANIAVSSSFIWGDKDPAGAYRALSKV